MRLVAATLPKGRLKIALPLTVTRLAEQLAGPTASRSSAPRVAPAGAHGAATADDVPFAGAIGGGYIFPEFLPAFDAVMSLGKLLELLAPHAGPLSEQIAQIPASTLVHKTVACPWSLKGTVMRTLTEEMQRGDGHDLSLLDGIKAFYKGGWAPSPDADEALFQFMPRGADRDASEQMTEGFVDRVRAVTPPGPR